LGARVDRALNKRSLEPQVQFVVVLVLFLRLQAPF
jgi:hypothetical protein